MRFFADGQNIPTDLLEARDNGEVVFLCGAGVSMPAGLPSFTRLAQEVIAELGVPEDASSLRLFQRALQERESDFAPPMDQVLGLLQREYGASQVERAVTRKLRTPRGADISYHDLVLRLSTDKFGRPRLVTTNFDLLFEAARKRLEWYAPPGLPSLSYGEPLRGLVYLHGRLNVRRHSEDHSQGLVLGAADFGRAYLAEGWASGFVRDLLARYTVVLLGYSAEDPPIRYLLEGLHSLHVTPPRQLYAFAEGDPNEIEARWRYRGVTAIPYPQSDRQHSALWNSLRAWGDRADDPVKWRANLLDRARKGPQALEPHERGQVAALISSPTGAKEFADGDPPLPAEWLCVFDVNIRYAKPGKRAWDDEAKEFDPLQAFGLDDDPTRAPDQGQQSAPLGKDFLSPATAEERGPNRTRLAGSTSYSEILPPRLHHLARWVAQAASHPATAWWAARQFSLHQRLRDLLDWSIDRNRSPQPPILSQAWKLLLEAFEHEQGSLQRDWYELQRSLERDGWTRGNLREFQRVVTPRLSVKAPLLAEPRPPQKSEDELSLRDIAHFEVAFLGKPAEIKKIPDDQLPSIIAALRLALERASSLLGDLEENWW
jgi:SIR2-like domain